MKISYMFPIVHFDEDDLEESEIIFSEDYLALPIGGCDYCKGNRLHSKNIREESAQEAMQEWYSMDRGRIFYAENRTGESRNI